MEQISLSFAASMSTHVFHVLCSWCSLYRTQWYIPRTLSKQPATSIVLSNQERGGTKVLSAISTQVLLTIPDSRPLQSWLGRRLRWPLLQLDTLPWQNRRSLREKAGSLAPPIRQRRRPRGKGGQKSPSGHAARGKAFGNTFICTRMLGAGVGTSVRCA